MKCKDEGHLLLYLDKELTLEKMNETKAHLASCPQCSHCLQEIKENLDFTRETMGVLWDKTPEADRDEQKKSWDRIRGRINFKQRRMNGVKMRKITIAAVIVLTLGLLGSVPAVRTAAANFLQVFRVEKVDSITITMQDMDQIQKAFSQEGNFNIENFGRINTQGKYEQVPLNLEQITELPFKPVLPASETSKEASYYLEKQPVMQISPDVKKVNQLLKDMGSSVLLPEELQGQTVAIKMGDFLSAKYEDFSFIQGPSPQVEVPAGVDVDKVVQAMLSIPFWPDNVKQQLSAITDWQHTLVIPVDENSKKVDVNGSAGVLISNTGYSSLVWQKNGLLYILEDHSAGQADMLEIAGSLR